MFLRNASQSLNNSLPVDCAEADDDKAINRKAAQQSLIHPLINIPLQQNGLIIGQQPSRLIVVLSEGELELEALAERVY
jgi:hypothetical protein